MVPAVNVGVPDVPVDVVGVGGGREVVLSWGPPAGSVVLNYVVQKSNNDGASWLLVDDGVSDVPGALVSGLTNGRVLLFRVRAVNSAGAGVWSEPVTVNVGTVSVL